MTDFFSPPDDLGEIRQSDLQYSLGEKLTAQALDALDAKDSLSGAYIFRRFQEAQSGGAFDTGGLDVNTGFNTPEQLEQADQVRQADLAAIPDTSIADAQARVKQEGLQGQVTLPDQPSIKTPVLNLMLSEGHERRDRALAIANGPQGFVPDALGLVTSIGAGMIDPVNAAAFSIPVLGEARWGKLLYSAGDSMLARAGVRALQGASQGAVGSAALAGADWWLHARDGQDYTMADALQGVLMGAGMGAVFHAGSGAAGDVLSRLRGVPLPGSPADLVNRGLLTGRDIPGEALSEEGVSPDQLAAIGPQAPENPDLLADPDQPVIPPHPADVLADLPPAAQEDTFRATVADIAADQPVRAADMLSIAADHDPRIAESFEAYHGSPHDFDQFDVSQIGGGEGAQTFGHGLYFAENEAVARNYRNELSEWRIDGLPADPSDPSHVAAATLAAHEGNTAAAISDLESTAQHGPEAERGTATDAIARLRSGEALPEAAFGHLYRVRINASQEHFLDWDKPIEEQPPTVKAAVDRLFPEGKTSWGYQLKTGGDVVRALGSEMAAGRPITSDPAAGSNALREAGVAGVKYLDQGSRAKGEGTRNFVVFDDKHIEITHKNGEPVRQSELPRKLHAFSAEARNWPVLPDGARISGHGDNGPVVQGLEGRWSDAVDWLQGAQTGDAIGVLEHPDVPGRIDVIWGSKRYGLEHIAAQHPEVLADLPERLARMTIDHRTQAGTTGERIVLTSPDRAETAVLRTHFEDGKKTWLLTAYTPESGPGGGIPESPSDRGPTRSSAQPAGNVAPESTRGNAQSHGDRAMAAATDPRWRQLADVRPAEDDPDVIADSRQAERLPEPASLVPERSLSAAEKAAADAEAIWRQIEPTLSEEERSAINERLQGLKDDKDTRERIITDGVACLLAAVT